MRENFLGLVTALYIMSVNGSQLAKMKKVYILHVFAMKFKGK